MNPTVALATRVSRAHR